MKRQVCSAEVPLCREMALQWLLCISESLGGGSVWNLVKQIPAQGPLRRYLAVLDTMLVHLLACQPISLRKRRVENFSRHPGSGNEMVAVLSKTQTVRTCSGRLMGQADM